MRGSHLTEEEFSGLLIGEGLEGRVYQHLEDCDLCRNEVDTLRRGTADFGAFCMEWAEFQATQSVAPPSSFTKRLGFKPSLGLSIGGALVTACLLAVVSVHHHVVGHEALLTSPLDRPSAKEIAMDNRWLQSMDADLESGPDNIIIPAAELKALRAHSETAHRALVSNE